MNIVKMKQVLIAILTKLPVFLFCVLFINVHNNLFGSENSIVGVILLIGIFKSFSLDFGFNAKQAACTIPLLYAIVTFGPKLSLVNPYVGIIVNVISIGLILIISSHNIVEQNYIPYLLGYMFCQGYDISGPLYMKRVISLMGCSVILAIIYYLMNRKKTYKRTIVDLFKEIDIHSTRTKWYIKLTVTLTVVMFVCELLAYPRGMWVILAVSSVITPFEEESLSRSKHRIPATILGTIVFFIIYGLLVPEEYFYVVMLCGGFLSMFLTSYFAKNIYNSFSALFTAVVLFSLKEAILIRIISNMLGVVIGLGSHISFERLFKKISNDPIEIELV